MSPQTTAGSAPEAQFVNQVRILRTSMVQIPDRFAGQKIRRNTTPQYQYSLVIPFPIIPGESI